MSTRSWNPQVEMEGCSTETGCLNLAAPPLTLLFFPRPLVALAFLP